MFRHELGRSYSDPGQTTRLYDVRAITKNRFGIVTASAPEREANAANNYVGGAFQLATPSIVRVEENGSNCQVTFKNVPYATQYDIYYGNYDSKGVKTEQNNQVGSSIHLLLAKKTPKQKKPERRPFSRNSC